MRLGGSCVMAAVLLVAGVARAEPPAVTRDFLAFCSQEQNLNDCTAAVTRLAVMLDFEGGANCRRSERAGVSGARARQTLHSVVAWIGARPHLMGRPTDDSIKTALGDLYPCK